MLPETPATITLPGLQVPMADAAQEADRGSSLRTGWPQTPRPVPTPRKRLQPGVLHFESQHWAPRCSTATLRARAPHSGHPSLLPWGSLRTHDPGPGTTPRPAVDNSTMAQGCSSPNRNLLQKKHAVHQGSQNRVPPLQAPTAGHPAPAGDGPHQPTHHGTAPTSSRIHTPPLWYNLKFHEFKPASDDGHCHPTPTPNVTPAENQPHLGFFLQLLLRFPYNTINYKTLLSCDIHRAFCFNNLLRKRKASHLKESQSRPIQPPRVDYFGVPSASLFPVQELTANAQELQPVDHPSCILFTWETKHTTENTCPVAPREITFQHKPRPAGPCAEAR